MVDELTVDIKVGKRLSNLSVSVFDAQGRLVRSNVVMDIDVNAGNKEYKIDVSEFDSGVYSLKIRMDSHVINKKVNRIRSIRINSIPKIEAPTRKQSGLFFMIIT